MKQSIKYLVLFLLIITNLNSFTLKTNPVETIKWERGETLLKFLEENSLPLKLYYNLDGEDKKVMLDIREGATCYIARDCCDKIYQVIIPLNEELEIHIYKDIEDDYILDVKPIPYKLIKKQKLITITSSFSDDIFKATKNLPLSLKLHRIFKGAINFKTLKRGDKVGIIYQEKTWMNKKFGTQKVFATFFEHKGKRVYRFLYSGRYYDQKAKVRKKVSTFIVPCRYRRISDRFTLKRWHPILHIYRPHYGIDYANKIGTPIYATYDGIVTYRGRRGGYGNFIQITHPNGYQSVYGHLSRYYVKKGQRVKRGQKIAAMGSTGLSTGSHLHFGIKYHGKWINPVRKIVIVKTTKSKLRKKILSIVRKYKPMLDKLR